MKKTLSSKMAVIFLILFMGACLNVQATCNEYIKQLSNGDIKFSVTFSVQKAYVEIFASKNDLQHLAMNISGSQQNNADGTFTYSYVMPASFYSVGNKILARFYSYTAGGAGVFSPGPSEGVWSQPFLYGQTTCEETVSCNEYIKQSASDVKFTVTFSSPKAYVEVFVTKNNVQHLAVNIAGSQVNNANGTYTYSYTIAGSYYTTGDKIQARFYSYAAGGPGIFTPGPTDGIWSLPFFYNQSNCDNAVYVSVNGNDNNSGTSLNPLRTIKKGLQIASSSLKSEVKVATGTYEEGNINIINGINLLGGYNSNFTSRDISSTTNVTVIDANQPTGFYVCGNARILNIENITSPTVIEGFTMTRGRLCYPGGGLYISNCNDQLIIRNNVITGNSSVGTNSNGGNIYLLMSSSKIYNNKIVNGFSGLGGGTHDLSIIGTYTGGVKSEIYNNIFSSTGTVGGIEYSNFYNNSFLTSPRLGEEDSDLSIVSGTTDLFNESANTAIFPNPTKGAVTIVLSKSTEPVHVELFNSLGMLIYENETSQSELSLDLSGYSKGIYQFVIKKGSSSTFKKVVLN